MCVRSISIISLLLLLMVGACISPQANEREKIMQRFAQLDSSLVESERARCDESYECLYKTIATHNATQHSLLADTIYNSTRAASAFLDALNNALKEEDATGESRSVTKKILSPAVIHDIRRKINAVRTNASLSDNSIHTSIDSIFSNTNDALSSDRKLENFMNNMPSIAARALLASLRNDCNYAATISLKGIKQRL